MTFEEKRQLCIHINNLEQKHLSTIIQIMHKSIPNLLDGKVMIISQLSLKCFNKVITGNRRGGG